MFFYTLSGNPHFRLLFDTGPNSDFSARFVLGFPSVDTPFKQYHFGQNLSSDIGLRLRRDECDLLVSDLFQKFDNDGSGDLSFEEFRDFYLQLLDTEPGLTLLRRYAKYRFKYLIRRAWWDEQVAQEDVKYRGKSRRRETERPARETQQLRLAAAGGPQRGQGL